MALDGEQGLPEPSTRATPTGTTPTGTTPTGAGPTEASRTAGRRPGPLVRVLLVGAVVGVVACVAFEESVVALVGRGVDRGLHPVLALLQAAALTYPVLVVTVLTTSFGAWVALRLLRVPRAFAVAGLSGVVLAVLGCVVVWNGVAFGGAWVCTPASAGVHGAAWLLVRPRVP